MVNLEAFVWNGGSPSVKVSAKTFSSVPGVCYTCWLPTGSSPAWPISIFLVKTISAKIMFLPGWKVVGREVVLNLSGLMWWGSHVPVTSLAVQDQKVA